MNLDSHGGHAGVGGEHGVGAGDLVDGRGDELGADGAARVLDDRPHLREQAAGEGTLTSVEFDEGALPVGPACIAGPRLLEVSGVGLGGDPVQQRVDREPCIGHDPEIHGCSAADVAAVAIDLDCRRLRRQPLRVREGLSTLGFDARRPPDAASLLPGLLAATRTGLSPAGDDELVDVRSPQRLHLHLSGHTKGPGYLVGTLARFRADRSDVDAVAGGDLGGVVGDHGERDGQEAGDPTVGDGVVDVAAVSAVGD